MLKGRRFLLIILAILSLLPVRAQIYSPQQIELTEQLLSLAKNAPPELAYIQTSKDIYETGEDLWFKVYLLDAQYLIPSSLSKTLYLKLLNEASKKTVWQEKYEIQNGFANGQVYLENNLPEGDYLLEAYTPNSFFNDTTEFKAVRSVKVRTDIISGPSVTVKSFVLDKASTIQFATFPEGGNLVSGIQSRLAFKAVNRNGEPVDIRGTLFEDDIPLMEFKSTHSGMGNLSFTPDTGKKYFIRLTEPAIDSTFFLPEIYPSGIIMQLIGRDEETLSFKVSQSPGLQQEDIYIRVQCRGIVYGMTTAKLNRELKIKIPLSGIPQGIAEVTLFNSSLIPLAERLVYINQDRKLNITADLSKEIFSTRGKVTLKITVKDEKGQPIEANLGVTVFDKIYQNPGDSINILSHFYLSNQLNGRIYNPSFYFNSNSKGRDEALDLLMLTQGWRKYVWNETNLKKFGEVLQKVIFDGTRGKLIIKTISEKTRYEKKFVMAYSPNRDKKKVLIPVDSAGEFTIPPDQLKEWQGDYVYLKPFWSHKYPPPLNLTDPFENIKIVMRDKEVSYPIKCLSTSKEETPELTISHAIIVIPEVTIKGNKTNIIRGKYMGTLDSLAKFEMNKDWVCIYGYLNCPNHGPDEPGSRKPKEGEWVKRILHPQHEPVVIDIVYHLPRYTEDQILRMNFLSRVKAYYGNRKFYQPNYDKETEEAIVPDFRNTLLWDPEVITDENGEATISFYCSDINTDFVGRIEGVGGEGLLGTGNFKFTVRNLKITP